MTFNDQSHVAVAVAPSPSTSSQGPSVKLCVFCGSSGGTDAAHLQAARDLGRVMAENNIHLVYGGGTAGMMGELAKTLVSLSGPGAVHGIIPEALVRYERDSSYTSSLAVDGDKKLAVPEEKIFGKMTVVKDMHTRKRLMAQEVVRGGPGSGFIALSGGFGTLEELLEVCTWNQLGIHDRGVCLFNVKGFYDGIIDWIKESTKEGFLRAGNEDILAHASTAEEAVKSLRHYRASDSVLKLAWDQE